MTDLYTLNEFIEYQLKNYGLDLNIKNKKKLRAFFTKTLKNEPEFAKKKIWDNAKTKVIGKTTAKLLDLDTLTALAKNPKSIKYMEKLMKKSNPEIHEYFKSEVSKHKKNWQLSQETPYYTDTPTYQDNALIERQADNYIEQTMLTAIFNHFFTPFDKNKVIEDIANVTLGLGAKEPLEFSDDPHTITADYRLHHPEKYYFSEKKNK